MAREESILLGAHLWAIAHQVCWKRDVRILRAYFELGMSFVEIGKAEDITSCRVRQRVKRALRKIKEEFDAQ